MKNLMDTAVITAKFKLNEFLTREDGDVNVVSIVVLIGVAVTLALVFKEQITTIMEGLLTAIKGNAETAIKPATP